MPKKTEDERTDEDILINKNKLELYYFPLAEHLSCLDYQQKGKLFEAIMNYEMVDEEPSFEDDRLLIMAFSSVRNQLDVSKTAYLNKSRKRAESGRMGGIASGNIRRLHAKQNEANEPNASETKQSEPNEADKIRNDKTRNEMIRQDIIRDDRTRQEMMDSRSPILNIISDTLDEEFNSISKDTTYKIIEYYLNRYEDTFNEKHPAISQNQIDRIIRNMPLICNDDGTVLIDFGRENTSEESVLNFYKQVLIDSFFEGNDSKDDCNIFRFFSGSVRAELIA